MHCVRLKTAQVLRARKLVSSTMPSRAPRLCPGCRRIITDARCPSCTPEPFTSQRPRVRKHPSRVNARAWRRLRLQVFDEQGFICAEPECVQLCTRLDHITPIQEGGSDERSNLQGLCEPHHDEKTQREAQRASHPTA